MSKHQDLLEAKHRCDDEAWRTVRYLYVGEVHAAKEAALRAMAAHADVETIAEELEPKP